MDYKNFFKDKKITVMGLGLLGRSLGVVKFLAECGADLTVTDLKPASKLKPSLKELRKYKGIKYTLGKHQLFDFRNRDMIIKSAGVPLDSIYIKEAKKNRIPIEMDVSLFVKLAPKITIVGITGTRGKSMTTMLIYEILSKNIKKHKVFPGGNIKGIATLPLLKTAKSGDILVAELDSWQLQGFGEAKISPHISVFTSFMPDHMNYYKDSMKKYLADKANIFKYQKKGDFLIVRPGVKKLIPKNLHSQYIVSEAKRVADYSFSMPGKFQQENLACAVEVAKIFKIPEAKIKKAVKNFKGIEGRLQYLKKVMGVKIYNDNNATTPEATMAGIEALSIYDKKKGFKKNIVLILGGADKRLPIDGLVKVINKYCKAVVLIPGSGTDRLTNNILLVENFKAKDVGTAIKKAQGLTKRGDIILFSPAFASFHQFQNEYERNDLFMNTVKKLK